MTIHCTVDGWDRPEASCNGLKLVDVTLGGFYPCFIWYDVTPEGEPDDEFDMRKFNGNWVLEIPGSISITTYNSGSITQRSNVPVETFFGSLDAAIRFLSLSKQDKKTEWGARIEKFKTQTKMRLVEPTIFHWHHLIDAEPTEILNRPSLEVRWV